MSPSALPPAISGVGEAGAFEDVHRLAGSVVEDTGQAAAAHQLSVAVLDDGGGPDDAVPGHAVDLLGDDPDEVAPASGGDEDLEPGRAQQPEQLDHRLVGEVVQRRVRTGGPPPPRGTPLTASSKASGLMPAYASPAPSEQVGHVGVHVPRTRRSRSRPRPCRAGPRGGPGPRSPSPATASAGAGPGRTSASRTTACRRCRRSRSGVAARRTTVSSRRSWRPRRRGRVASPAPRARTTTVPGPLFLSRGERDTARPRGCSPRRGGHPGGSAPSTAAGWRRGW